MALPEVARATTVMAFWSFGSELPTAPLIAGLHDRGVVVALPRIVDGELEARSYRPGDAMSDTTFGAREPAGGSLVDPPEIDMIVVPAVAFDRECRAGRLRRWVLRPVPAEDPARCVAGRRRIRPAAVAPGRALPAGHFDLRVDLVVTESETLRCRPTA